MRYQVKVNGVNDFEIVAANNELKVGGASVYFDAINLVGGHSHVLYQDKSYEVEVFSLDQLEKTVIVKVNGSEYQVAVTDQYDLLLKQLGMDSLQKQKVLEISAPMPGLVLKVLVEVGQEVSKGDNLLVLEAMKMENILKSTASGVIKNITIKLGDKVEKNQILLQFN